jgi:phosphoribosylformylglycinamidine (FGAM) synthase-like enzyme
VVGMVGRLADAARAGRAGFGATGDAIALVGDFRPSLRGSELAKLRGEAPAGPLPPMDAGAILAAHEAVRAAVGAGALRSAHDVAEGGVAVAVAECCVLGVVGATVEWAADEAALFGEAPGRAFLISGPPDTVAAVPGARVVGTVGGDRVRVGPVDLGLEELGRVRREGLAAAV